MADWFQHHIDALISSVALAVPSFLIGRRGRQMNNLSKGFAMYRELLNDLDDRYKKEIDRCKAECQQEIQELKIEYKQKTLRLEQRIKKLESK